MNRIGLISFFAFCIIVVSPIRAQDTLQKKMQLNYKNHVHFIMSDVVFKRVSFEYERLLGEEGKMSIKIPVSYSFGDVLPSTDNIGPIDLTTMPDWFVGLGLNLYPKGQGKFRFYFGAEFRMGESHSYDYLNVAYDENGGGEQFEVRDSFFQTAFLANAGIMYEPVERFIVGVNLGIGYASSSDDNTITSISSPEFRMGFRF